MTPFKKVYDAFSSKIIDDEYSNWTEEEVEKDLHTLLLSALPWFKFPRQSLEIGEQGFLNDLTNEEIQLIATYMKCEWLNRTILTWENVRPLYDERDFSQANLIDKFSQMLENENSNAKRLEAVYYRSVGGKPFDYTRLAGGGS